MKEKKPRRNKVKNASLKKRYNSRIRQEYIDMDYIDKLDKTKKNCKLPDGTMVTELEFMSIFMKEWNNGGVGKQSKAKENRLHRTAQEVKDCTDRNNSRNRDEYGIAKARNLVCQMGQDSLNKQIESAIDNTTNVTEDCMIELLDQAKQLTKTSSDSQD